MIKHWIQYLLLVFLPYLLPAQVQDSIPVGKLKVAEECLLTIKSLDKDKKFFKKQQIKFEYELEDSTSISLAETYMLTGIYYEYMAD